MMDTKTIFILSILVASFLLHGCGGARAPADEPVPAEPVLYQYNYIHPKHEIKGPYQALFGDTIELEITGVFPENSELRLGYRKSSGRYVKYIDRDNIAQDVRGEQGKAIVTLTPDELNLEQNEYLNEEFVLEFFLEYHFIGEAGKKNEYRTMLDKTHKVYITKNNLQIEPEDEFQYKLSYTPATGNVYFDLMVYFTPIVNGVLGEERLHYTLLIDPDEVRVKDSDPELLQFSFAVPPVYSESEGQTEGLFRFVIGHYGDWFSSVYPYNDEDLTIYDQQVVKIATDKEPVLPGSDEEVYLFNIPNYQDGINVDDYTLYFLIVSKDLHGGEFISIDISTQGDDNPLFEHTYNLLLDPDAYTIDELIGEDLVQEARRFAMYFNMDTDELFALLGNIPREQDYILYPIRLYIPNLGVPHASMKIRATKPGEYLIGELDDIKVTSNEGYYDCQDKAKTKEERSLLYIEYSDPAYDIIWGESGFETGIAGNTVSFEIKNVDDFYPETKVDFRMCRPMSDMNREYEDFYYSLSHLMSEYPFVDTSVGSMKAYVRGMNRGLISIEKKIDAARYYDPDVLRDLKVNVEAISSLLDGNINEQTFVTIGMRAQDIMDIMASYDGGEEFEGAHSEIGSYASYAKEDADRLFNPEAFEEAVASLLDLGDKMILFLGTKAYFEPFLNERQKDSFDNILFDDWNNLVALSGNSYTYDVMIETGNQLEEMMVSLVGIQCFEINEREVDNVGMIPLFYVLEPQSFDYNINTEILPFSVKPYEPLFYQTSEAYGYIYDILDNPNCVDVEANSYPNFCNLMYFSDLLYNYRVPGNTPKIWMTKECLDLTVPKQVKAGPGYGGIIATFRPENDYTNDGYDFILCGGDLTDGTEVVFRMSTYPYEYTVESYPFISDNEGFKRFHFTIPEFLFNNEEVVGVRFTIEKADTGEIVDQAVREFGSDRVAYFSSVYDGGNDFYPWTLFDGVTNDCGRSWALAEGTGTGEIKILTDPQRKIREIRLYGRPCATDKIIKGKVLLSYEDEPREFENLPNDGEHWIPIGVDGYLDWFIVSLEETEGSYPGLGEVFVEYYDYGELDCSPYVSDASPVEKVALHILPD
ncbi:MAG: hypothetical protein KKF44_04605 [Nanoarchaeota archaeon]|nr:hypothetical protein [Nanoarchaeota archaeon]